MIWQRQQVLPQQLAAAAAIAGPSGLAFGSDNSFWQQWFKAVWSGLCWSDGLCQLGVPRLASSFAGGWEQQLIYWTLWIVALPFTCERCGGICPACMLVGI
jgi:hypothetical protein